MIELTPTAVDDAAARSLLDEYVAFRVESFPGPRSYLPARPDREAFTGDGLFVVASVDGTASGCGGVRMVTPERYEIKHLFVRPTSRGRGIGRAILDRLETHARSAGARELVLDTHSSLTNAAVLYRSQGFETIDAYNSNPNADRWYLKVLM